MSDKYNYSRTKIDGVYTIVEYSNLADFSVITATIRTQNQAEDMQVENFVEASIQEQILAETQYQTSLIELMTLGGS